MQNDSEKEKMRSALGSAIMMEKPNVKVWHTQICFFARSSAIMQVYLYLQITKRKSRPKRPFCKFRNCNIVYSKGLLNVQFDAEDERVSQALLRPPAWALALPKGLYLVCSGMMWLVWKLPRMLSKKLLSFRSNTRSSLQVQIASVEQIPYGMFIRGSWETVHF